MNYKSKKVTQTADWLRADASFDQKDPDAHRVKLRAAYQLDAYAALLRSMEEAKAVVVSDQPCGVRAVMLSEEDGTHVCRYCDGKGWHLEEYEPIAHDSKRMLEFLAARFEYAGVGEAVAKSYARGIRLLLAQPTTNQQETSSSLVATPPVESGEAKDAARYRKFLSMVDPDLMPGGFTIYFALEEGADQLCFDSDVTELVDAAMNAESREN